MPTKSVDLETLQVVVTLGGTNFDPDRRNEHHKLPPVQDVYFSGSIKKTISQIQKTSAMMKV